MKSRLPIALLLIFLIARAATLGLSPLMDKTEGRYGEIGREMAESGDWITPTLHGGEPFWGKPPLHFWLTAASFRLFGVNEWAARLPSLFAGLIILILFFRLAKELGGEATARISSVVLLSSLLFHLLLGQVILDVTFTACLTGAFVSYAYHVRDRSGRLPGYGFFLSLGFALLAKGPVGVVLAFLAIGIHAVLFRSPRPVFRLPWPGGIPLTLLVAAPWYLLAEKKTPGFWNYFFINEHLMRYLKTDYGDQYGHGHTAPYGLIWVLALAALLPWTPIILRYFWRSIRRGSEVLFDDNDTVKLILPWALAPLLFFTLSRSLSFPYVLPAIPALSLLVGRILIAGPPRPSFLAGSGLGCALLLIGGAIYGAVDFRLPLWKSCLLVLPLVVLALSAVWAGRRESIAPALTVSALIIPVAIFSITVLASKEAGEAKSTRHLAVAVQEETGGEAREVLFFDGLPYSAEFYFRGQAIDLVQDRSALAREIADPGEEILIVRKSRESYLPQPKPVALRPLTESGNYTIYLVSEP